MKTLLGGLKLHIIIVTVTSLIYRFCFIQAVYKKERHKKPYTAVPIPLTLLKSLELISWSLHELLLLFAYLILARKKRLCSKCVAIKQNIMMHLNFSLIFWYLDLLWAMEVWSGEDVFCRGKYFLRNYFTETSAKVRKVISVYAHTILLEQIACWIMLIRLDLFCVCPLETELRSLFHSELSMKKYESWVWMSGSGLVLSHFGGKWLNRYETQLKEFILEDCSLLQWL